MHIVIAAIGILTAVYFFVMRARNAADMTNELLDVADDVRAAARRHSQTVNRNHRNCPSLELARPGKATYRERPRH